MNPAPDIASPDESPLLTAALSYAARGWSVIPCRKDKRPHESWKRYQSERATEQQIREWWARWPDANVGIVTGAVSGLVVVDCDGKAGVESFKSLGLAEGQTTTAVTGHGAHIYFQHPGGTVGNFAGKRPGLDFRGDGGYVIAPPSIHPSGKTYSFFDGCRPDQKPLAPLPGPIRELLAARGNPSREPSSAKVLDFSQAPTHAADAPIARWVESAIEREIGRVVAAPDGTRNNVLNEAAFSLGQIVGAAAAQRGGVEKRLMTAATRSGLPEAEARRTIASGIEDGMAQPRDLSAVGAGSRPADREAQPVVFRAGETAGQTVGTQEAPAEHAPPAIDISAFRLDRQTAGEPPPRRWLVTGCFPLAVPCVFYGPGGVGKSLAAIDLAIKVATRGSAGALDPVTAFGRVPSEAQGAAVVITLEDDRDEIHRRAAGLDPTNQRDGAPCYLLPGLDMPGFDPSLIRQDRGRLAALTRFASEGMESLLTEVATDAGQPVRLLVLDPAGDFLEGSEDDAAVVKPLMRRLRELAARHGCTILLVGHTAKGQMDQDAIAARGMRGSGAWIANARAAFGLWRPDDKEAKNTLRKLEMPLSPENIGRVVYGRMVKANHPGADAGTRRYLQDAATGLVRDFSDHFRGDTRDEKAENMALLLGAIGEAVEHRMPYQLGGASGLYPRRETLPKPLSMWGEKKLLALGNEALADGLIVRCRIAGSTAPRVLDLPGGPYATGMEDQVGFGSLAEAKRAKKAARS